MKVVVAPDKFRGSLSAPEAAEAIALGVLAAVPCAMIDRVPMADGGEGTVEALVAATGGTFREAEVTGPLGTPVQARYGILGDRMTAVIEMAEASGHRHVPKNQKDPSKTTTKGTGELLLAALDAGARRIILGIGGSATNDGGAGLAEALGYRLLDENDNPIPPGGGGLAALARIDASLRDPRLELVARRFVTIEVACDVDNPLCGPRGASAVYGPQKGADPVMVARLDANLARLAARIKEDLGHDIADLPGAGAAGGLGAGLVAFAGAKLMPGAPLVIRAVDLKKRLEDADLCLTGEGLIDLSSAAGKTAVGVSRLARSMGCPAIALAGAIAAGAEPVLNEGIVAYFSLCPGPITLDDALAQAAPLLSRAAEQAVRCFLAGRDHSPRGL
ncbi:MAG: glycerate kinase [Isosphaeraceae bacterium]